MKLDVTVLDDGSAIVRRDTVLQHVQVNGTLDSAWGSNGTVGLSSQFAQAYAVDRTTGRLALRTATGFELRNSSGHITQTLVDAQRFQFVGRYAFDDQGRLLFSNTGDTSAQPAPTNETISRLNADGSIDTGFAAATVRGTVSHLDAGPNHSMLVVSRWSETTLMGADNEYVYHYDRFTWLDAQGHTLAGFGNGSVDVAAGSEHSSPNLNSSSVGGSTIDVAPSGVILIAEQTTSTSDASDATYSSELHAYRLRAITLDGQSLVSNPVAVLGEPIERLVGDAGGHVYAIGNGVIYRLNSDLTPDAAWNGFNGARITTNGYTRSLDVDSSGRLWMVEQRANLTKAGDYAVRVFDGSVGGFGVPAETITLLPDGTLDIAGTGGKDKVRVWRDHASNEVVARINKRESRFALTHVNGLLVHTGKGSDRIEIDPSMAANEGTSNEFTARVYIQSGTGNDTVLGGPGMDTIETSGGNDYIDAGAGNDLVWGSGGDDTVIGGLGADTLYGGAGADELHASPPTAVREPERNELYGGTGVDVFYRSLKVQFVDDLLDQVAASTGETVI
ncbi:MAG: hypothetical protein QM770_21605 [Tepidisphaeraceae bacterium]